MQNKKLAKASVYRLWAILVMLLWGSLYPGIKLGYKYLEINTKSVPDIMMFAGNRFLVCGSIIMAIALVRGDKLDRNVKNSVWPVINMGLTGVVLHYILNYTSLTMVESGRAAILKAVGPLFYICFSFLIIRDEKFSIGKMLGAVMGFLGIAAMNTDAVGGFSIHPGDLMMIGASLLGIISNLLGKKAMNCNSPVMVTGVSQLFGGVVLSGLALVLGASAMKISAAGLIVFAYICFASIVAYCIWYRIMKLIPLSEMYLIKFLEPVFACVFGAVCLGETLFRMEYLIALILICAGITIGQSK